MQYANEIAKGEDFVLSICLRTAMSLDNSLAFAFPLIDIGTDPIATFAFVFAVAFICIHIQTYGSTTVCLDAFTIFVAFTFTYCIP